MFGFVAFRTSASWTPAGVICVTVALTGASVGGAGFEQPSASSTAITLALVGPAVALRREIR